MLNCCPMGRIIAVMRVTIHEIARRAGVSPSTVSRALNGKGRMRPETRERILRIARELNYRPNAHARGLATKKTHCIGVGISERHMPVKRSFYNVILSSLESTLASHGYHLVFSVLHNEEIPRCVSEGRVDGFIILGTDVQRSLVRTLVKRVPILLVDNHLPGVDAIAVDNTGGAYFAVEHLISHGHRRIAFMVETMGDPNFEERFLGYRKALEDHGISFDEQLLVEGRRERGFVRIAVRKFLEIKPLPTAIFAANDYTAAGAISLLREEGLRVPEDVAVVGFDDGEVAAYISPPLTTVFVPRGDMGRLAALRMVELLEGKEKRPRSIVLAPELVRRRSCGCHCAT